jgi:predicted O-linked N-acetylglucosamine transferase (SPINDLY family)
VSNLVDYLKRQCMISGSNAAWLAYFSAVLAEQPDERRYWYPYIWAQGWYARTAPRRTQSGYGRPNAAAGKEPPAKSMAELDNLLRTVSLARAEALARRLVSEYGQSSNAWLALGCLCRDAGNSEEALAALAKALAISPADVRIHAALGLVFIEKALLPEAEATYRTGLAIDPELPALLTNLGGLLRRMNRQDEALFFYSKALELKGGGGELSNVGSALLDLGKLGEASAHYRRAMAAQPENYLLHSNLLFLLSHDDTLTAEQLFQAHREFGLKLESKASRLYRPHDNTREPERKLRLGFVSADLYSHAMANFIDPIWSALDPQNFEIHAYSANSFEDDVTGKLRVHTAGWRMVANLGPDDLARQIRDDGIDILFDLSGHTGENRLAVFARKPAPIQITWMGYPGTTGLAAMDYYFLERHVAPRGFLDDQFTEKLVYMSATGVFQPENDSPDIGPAPVLKNGYVTFGSFNRPMKITESTMAGWGAILRALPHSRMLVGNMQGKQVQDMMVARFKEQQIGADRLLFRSRGTVGQYLQMHDDVDILLDSFPYTGGTTSYHALWMGVPILTLQGRTRVSRQTAEILALAGLKECVADTQEQWVENAVRLAGDPLQLAELRATMRERLTSSIQLRSDILIKDLQAALRAMWLRWCAGQAPASFDVDDRPLID